MADSLPRAFGIPVGGERARLWQGVSPFAALTLVVLLMVLSLAACGGPNPSPTARPSLTPLTPSPTPLTPSPTTAPTPSPTTAPTPSPTPVPHFVSTGSMHHGRIDATATLLSNGKVLIAGGNPADVPPPDFSPVQASAELYDPATGTFTPTGSMLSARSDATATLLSDGRVLVAGGFGCVARPCTPGSTRHGSDYLSSAELYDPTSGTFSRTGSMSVARADANAMLLPDGRVLILNGGSRVAEVYDPTTGKFSRDGSLLSDYYGSYRGKAVGTVGSAWATLLPSGKVLVAGPDRTAPLMELFDPETGKSTSISLELPKGALAASQAHDYASLPVMGALLKDGRVLLAVFGYLVTYDPVTGSFTQSGSISDPGSWSPDTTTLLPGGGVLLAGGIVELLPYGGESIVPSAGLYEPAPGFRTIGSMNAARAGATATRLTDGTVLIAGGVADDMSALSSAELLEP